MASLDPIIKKEWVDLLRGGEIRQTFRTMCRTDGSCCALGVLAKVLEKRGILVVDPEPVAGGKLLTVHKASGDKGIGNLPMRARSEIGLCDPDYGMDMSRKVMILNDEGKRSFSEIADYIEANL